MFVRVSKYLELLHRNSYLEGQVEREKANTDAYKRSNDIRDSAYYEKKEKEEKGWITDTQKRQHAAVVRERDDALLKYKVLCAATKTPIV